MLNQVLRTFAAIATLLLLASPALAGSAAAAQPGEGMYSLTVDTAFCEPGYAGPFVGCTPWDGVTVSVLVETADGTVSDACVTVAGERTATCSVNVPYGATITALVNPAMIPAGYVLEGSASIELTIPAGPPEGLFTGPAFVLFPAEAPAEPAAPGGFPLPANTAFCEPGYAGPFVGCTPWEGVTVSFMSSDGAFATSCVTSGTERAAGCVVDVPFGSTITASIDPASIPAGYMLERSASVEIAIPGGPPEGVFTGASFVLLPASPVAVVVAEDTTETAGMPASVDVGSCADPLASETVAQLDDVVMAAGPEVGFGDAVPVATSYTELDVPFNQLIDGGHVLTVFDATGAGNRIACGGIGGVLEANGSLAVGLVADGEGGLAVIAYISPLADGAGSAITLFVSVPPAPGEGE